MTIGGAVCEFNPFHSGHKHFLDQAKKSGADALVCVMSGNFVQRGEIAVCDKYKRAEAAVKNGADLVLELPIPFSLGTAETFARGAVGIIDRLGCVEKLFFGAENPLDDIFKASKELEKEDVKEKIRFFLDSGLSYPDAVAASSSSDVFSGANNTLALEYIKQLSLLHSTAEPVRIERKGAGHDERNEKDGFLSASAIRDLLRRGADCREFLPCPVNAEDLADQGKLEIAVLSKLRTLSVEELSRIADVNEGLEYRIRAAVDVSKSVEEVASRIKTKRYTNAKIRRILLCAYLGVTKEMQLYQPSFVNVLATNEVGLSAIKEIKAHSDFTVICRHADANGLSDKDRALYDFCSLCDDLYSLALPQIRECGYNQKRRFFVTG